MPHLILVLDESGSMHSQKSDIVGGVNSMIEQQRNMISDRSCMLTIVKFSDFVRPLRHEHLHQVPFMTDADYNPSGSTALFDAICSTIEKYKEEKDVVMVIATDGQENASKTHTRGNVTRMIADQREHKNWDFIYLSEDVDTFSQGNSMGLSNSTRGAFNCAVGKGGLDKAFRQQSFNVAMCSKVRKSVGSEEVMKGWTSSNTQVRD